MNKSTRKILRGCGYAAVILIPTWLFFAPVAAFHHMIRCGAFTPIFLDGESPRSGVSLFLDKYEVRVFPELLLVSIVLWVVCVFVGCALIRRGFRHDHAA